MLLADGSKNSAQNLAFSNEIYTLAQALFLIYNQGSVLYNEPTPDKVFSLLKAYHKADIKKLPAFNLGTIIPSSPRHKHKPFKTLLSKVMKNYGKNYLFVIDIANFASLSILLESFFENPSKNHAIDPKTGYAFLYDNKGNISIIVAKISGEWAEKLSDKDRKICSLSIFDQRVDPTLHLINNLDGSLLLLVVGGHENGVLMQDMQIFWVDFERKIGTQPLLRVKLRYPRLKPLIFHMKVKEKNDTRIYILGGTSAKPLKKEGIVIKNDDSLLEEGKKSCETIYLNKINEKLLKNEIVRSNEANEMITMDKSFQIFGDKKLLSKLDTVYEGGVIKLRVGFHSKNKCAFLLGVGKSRASVYQIEYIDEKGQKLHMLKKLQKALSPGFLCNSMFKVKEKTLFYLSDNNKEKYDVVDLANFEGKKTVRQCYSCEIF